MLTCARTQEHGYEHLCMYAREHTQRKIKWNLAREDEWPRLSAVTMSSFIGTQSSHVSHSCPSKSNLLPPLQCVHPCLFPTETRVFVVWALRSLKQKDQKFDQSGLHGEDLFKKIIDNWHFIVGLFSWVDLLSVSFRTMGAGRCQSQDPIAKPWAWQDTAVCYKLANVVYFTVSLFMHGHQHL